MPRRAPKRAAESGQPHDALFRFAFSQPEHAAGLLAATLPPPLVAALDLGSLALVEGSFVDPALRSHHADLVFSVRAGGEPLLVYTLVEHQRRVDALMAFRVGVYMMRLWEHVVREEPARTTLPAIVPIVVHHSATGWAAATRFDALVALPEPARTAVLPHTPCFSFRLVDLSAGGASELLREALTALGRVVLWALEVAGDDARMEVEVAKLTGALDEMLAAPGADGALTALLRYLCVTHPSRQPAEIVEMIERTVETAQKEKVVDVLDVFRKEGRVEGERVGRLAGRAEGRAKTLLELLAARFGPVPAEVKARVLAAKEPTLARWALRVLTARSMEAVFTAPARHAAAPKRRAKR
jgi:predicted transposase YdaD